MKLIIGRIWLAVVTVLIGSAADAQVTRVMDLNSTATNLANAAAFTGTNEDVTGCRTISASVYASHASAANGMSMEFSSDRTNWDVKYQYSVSATTALVKVQTVQGKWFRLVYTNGATTTTALRLQALCHSSVADAPSTTGGSTVEVTTFPDNEPVNVAQVNGVAPSMGNGVSGTGVQRVTLASDSTGQVALATGAATIGALTANQSVNAAQVAGTATATGNGVVGAGVQRVAVASDNTAFSVNVGTFPDNEPVNVNQLGGTALAVPFDADSGAGTQNLFGVSWRKVASGGSLEFGTSSDPVRIDPTGTTVQPATQSGTWTVQPGNTANTTAWLVTGTGGTFPIQATAAAPGSVRLSDGASFYDGAKTGQLPAALVGGRLDIVVGAALPTGTNVIGALSVNQSVNTAQFGGSAVATGTGAGGVGIPRVTISNDSSLAANQSANVNQIGGVAISTGVGATGTGVQRFVAATNDPCQSSGIAKSSVVISATADAELVAFTTGQTVFACGWSLTMGGTAPTYRFVYGTGTTCATGLIPLTGTYAPTVGSYNAMTGGGATIVAAAVSNALCIDVGGTTPDAQGVLTYVKQ